MKVSVIIPAHNEQDHLGRCLDSIANSSRALGRSVEKVIVLNRCSDDTERIARAAGALVVREDARNLAKIRNAGVRASSGEIVVTIDADSTMSENMLPEIHKALSAGRSVGGGVPVRFERYSLGIRLAYFFLKLYLWATGLSGGLYWVLRRDFDAIGGFDEGVAFGEDIDFARRLKKHGKTRGLKYETLSDAFITTSCRKFDRFGDWYFFRLILLDHGRMRRSLRGEDSSFADEYFYDFNRKE